MKMKKKIMKRRAKSERRYKGGEVMNIEFYDKISGDVVFSDHDYYYAVTEDGDVLQIGDLHILTPCGVDWRVLEEGEE